MIPSDIPLCIGPVPIRDILAFIPTGDLPFPALDGIDQFPVMDMKIRQGVLLPLSFSPCLLYTSPSPRD